MPWDLKTAKCKSVKEYDWVSIIEVYIIEALFLSNAIVTWYPKPWYKF